MRSSRGRAARALTPPYLSREENAEGVKCRKEDVLNKPASSFGLPPSFTSHPRLPVPSEPARERTDSPGARVKGDGKANPWCHFHDFCAGSVFTPTLPNPAPLCRNLLDAGDTHPPAISVQSSRVPPAAVGCAAVPRQPGDRWGPGGCVQGVCCRDPCTPSGRVQGAGRDPEAPCGAGTWAVVTSPRGSDRHQALPTTSCFLPEPQIKGFERCQQSVRRGRSSLPPRACPSLAVRSWGEEGVGKGPLEGVSREVFAGSCR